MKTFILYGYDDPDDAPIIDVCEGEEAAINYPDKYGGVWYQYDRKGDELINGEERYDISNMEESNQ